MSLTGGVVDEDVLTEALQRKATRYDKSGEQHYDLISALHKSVRNSDENASLYWLARMLEGGEDRRYLARRIVRIASEDIGLADPFALRIALDATEAFDRLGVPRGTSPWPRPWSTWRALGRATRCTSGWARRSPTCAPTAPSRSPSTCATRPPRS